MSRPPHRDAMREASALFQAGAVLLPVLGVTLILGLEMSIPDGLFVAFLLATLPLLSMAQLPLLHAGEVERLPAYAGSAAMLAFLAALGLLLGHLGPGLGALGLTATGSATEWRILGGLVLAVGGLGVAFHFLGEWLGLEETPVLKELIPRTPKERRFFGILSLAAGFGEEVVYRGYLLAVLAPLFSGSWSAAVVSSLAFAVLHVYQGPVGMVRAGLLGFLFAGAFILGGTLWPLVVVHTGVDLVSGLWLGPRMLNTETRGPEAPSDDE
ncbi:MAG TPA: CPBP family intramembrane glutamic endopeptidase [Longimicrobiales bacterium]|nr:CPBP family intramembrane glutamic endopeptidase [Longimicrobiales bacterium]